jgi:hypothetical protein
VAASPDDVEILRALAGRKKTAFRDLERAVACGLDAVEHMLKDKDLKKLHGDSRWGPLVAGVRANGRKSAGDGEENGPRAGGFAEGDAKHIT